MSSDSAGHARLFPRVTNPNWLVLRARREIFRAWLRELSRPGLQVLDVGGRIQPYRPLLGGDAVRYVGVDLERTASVDVVADAARLPFADAQFDLALCTQVLEYVADPMRTVGEIYRVLKPGGVLLLSVPSIYPADSSVDGWRFFPAAIRQVANDFQAVQIVAEGNSVVGLLRTVNVWMDWFARPALIRQLCRITFIPILNLLAVVVNACFRIKDDSFCPNYSARAQK